MLPLNITSRTVTAPDADASELPFWVIKGAAWCSIGASCTTANQSITYRLVFADLEGNLCGVSPPVTLTSGAGAADWGGAWLGTPAGDPSINVSSDRMAVKVDAVTGVWTLAAQAVFPAEASTK
jgi:hypothetical protein